MHELFEPLDAVGGGRMPAGGTTDLPSADAPDKPATPPFCETNG